MGGLRIWVDALVLDEQAAGVGQYIRSLCEAYAKLYPTDALFGFFQPGVIIPGVNPVVVESASFSPRRIFYEQTRISRVVRRAPYDVIHFADYQLPLWRTPPRAVITVHDMSAFVLPEVFPPSKTRAKRFLLSQSVRRAAHVIVPSESTKHDLMEILQVGPQKIHVVRHGVKDRGRALDHRVHERPYFLAVGTVEPRKNFGRLIQAYQRLAGRLRELPDLVIAGRWGWMYDETVGLPGKLGVAEKVKFLQYVSEDTLTTLYRDAVAMIYPSLYEGFGLPVIEAMQAGTPVVTTNRGALAELGGDLLWRVDPLDVENIANAMLAVMSATDDVLERAKKAQAWTGQLTWENAAQRTREVYQRAALGG